MKTIICGSRHFSNSALMAKAMEHVNWKITEVVSGCAPGADTLGEDWAAEAGIPIKRFPADWKRYGHAAGPIRNGEMAKYAEACVAFLYEGSRGTQNMIKQATKRGLRVHIVHCDKPDPWSLVHETNEVI